MWYFKLFGLIVKIISIERDKCFAFPALHLVFSIFLFLYCKHWCLFLVWLFVPLLIIVELFLWFGWSMVFILALRGFHVKQIMSLVSSWFLFALYILLVLLTGSCKFGRIYFRCLLLCYWVCYCVGLFFPSGLASCMSF